jgi:cell division protein FtsB
LRSKILAIVLITVIALSMASWFVYNQIGNLQNQIDELQAQNSVLQDQNRALQAQVSEIQDQLNESQNQSDTQQDYLSDITYELALERPLRVLITKFKWVGDFNPIVNLAISHSVKVTVQNTDVIGVSGLTLTVRLLNKGTSIEVKDSMGFSSQIDMLNAGESREISGGILAALGSFSGDSAVCAVRLTVRDIVLDEGTYNLS